MRLVFFGMLWRGTVRLEPDKTAPYRNCSYVLRFKDTLIWTRFIFGGEVNGAVRCGFDFFQADGVFGALFKWPKRTFRCGSPRLNRTVERPTALISLLAYMSFFFNT